MKEYPGGGARAGELNTAHGRLPTPVFMPVGSQATVKTLTPQELSEVGIRILVANTYHLYLRPGVGVIEGLGGLHRFMSWGGAILTDSGGYQVFSLSALRKITDEGVTFRSHIDGSQHLFTPELSISLQESLGADIIMVLDECPPYSGDEEAIRRATERTHRWAERCRRSHRRPDQLLFGIVQGGTFAELRRQSAVTLTQMDFPGYAIGGLCLGEPKALTLETIEATVPWLPSDRPRYLMGVGSPEDIVESVSRGIDVFDCALPTQVARRGAVYTRQGRYNIRRAVHSRKEGPLASDCDCYTCRHFSAAYVHHLFRSQELLAYRLATIHNLRFMARLMARIREAIMDGSFEGFRADFLAEYQPTDDTVRVAQKQKRLAARQRSQTAGG